MPVAALKAAPGGRSVPSANVTTSPSSSDVVTINVASVPTVTLNTASTVIFGTLLAETARIVSVCV